MFKLFIDVLELLCLYSLFSSAYWECIPRRESRSSVIESVILIRRIFICCLLYLQRVSFYFVFCPPKEIAAGWWWRIYADWNVPVVWNLGIWV